MTSSISWLSKDWSDFNISPQTHQESTASCCQSVCGGSPDMGKLDQLPACTCPTRNGPSPVLSNMWKQKSDWLLVQPLPTHIASLFWFFSDVASKVGLKMVKLATQIVPKWRQLLITLMWKINSLLNMLLVIRASQRLAVVFVHNFVRLCSFMSAPSLYMNILYIIYSLQSNVVVVVLYLSHSEEI